jgi:8-oxo-dGTP diphosphatase
MSYVCGFLFSKVPSGTRVLLIQKARPRWQCGKLNGIGGKIESGETALEAMHREFSEEARLEDLSWQAVAVLRGAEFEVHFFSAWCEPYVFYAARAGTDEPLVTANPDDLCRLPVIPNLRFLVPLALDDTGIVKPVMLADIAPLAA